MLGLAAFIITQANPEYFSPLEYTERGIIMSYRDQIKPDKPRASCYISGEFYRTCPELNANPLYSAWINE